MKWNAGASAEMQYAMEKTLMSQHTYAHMYMIYTITVYGITLQYMYIPKILFHEEIFSVITTEKYIISIHGTCFMRKYCQSLQYPLCQLMSNLTIFANYTYYIKFCCTRKYCQLLNVQHNACMPNEEFFLYDNGL